MIAAAVSVEFNCIEDFSDTPHIQAVRMFFSAIIPEIDSPIYYYNDTLSNSIKMTACGPAGLSSEGFEMIFPKGCTGCRRCAVGLFRPVRSPYGSSWLCRTSRRQRAFSLRILDVRMGGDLLFSGENPTFFSKQDL